jgi:hypothetical protein
MWRYHKETKLWIYKDRSQSAAQGQPPNSANSTYVYFDINTWERRMFRESNFPGTLKFMTEEELNSL